VFEGRDGLFVTSETRLGGGGGCDGGGSSLSRDIILEVLRGSGGLGAEGAGVAG
jgi:hypothetical protein